MKRYKLKDLSIGKLEYGSGAAACEYDGSTRYVRITDIDSNGKLGNDIVSPNYVDEKYILNEGDVLFARTGATVGKTYRYHGNDGRCLYAGFLIRVIPNQKIIRPDYLYYFTKSPQYNSFVQSSMKVVAQPNINAKQYGELEFNVPELAVQDEIIEKLSKVVRVIDARKLELLKLDNLIKARFVELFGDPITNTKCLDTKELKDVLILKAGDFTAASDISDEPSETNIYPCYGGNGIRGYVAEYNQEGEYSLVGRQGALSGNVQYAKGKFKNTEHALLVTPIIEMNSIWLNQLLINLDLKRYQTGAAQPGLSVKNLQEIQIIMVPLAEQNEFATFVEQVDKSKVEVQKVLAEAQLLFDSLMQKYFG